MAWRVEGHDAPPVARDLRRKFRSCQKNRLAACTIAALDRLGAANFAFRIRVGI